MYDYIGDNRKRDAIKFIEDTIRIQADTETKNLNLLQFTGTLQILKIRGEVEDDTATSNMEDVYYDIWDGTNSKVLCANTDFSGIILNAFFTKLGDTTEELTLHNPTENRVTDLTVEDIGQPFIITAKNDVDNFIRLNFTTSTILDITINIIVSYRTIDGGTIAFV